MLKKLIHALLMFIALAAPAFAHAQGADQVQAGSAWVNQLGSVLHIDSVGSNGQLTGTYVNKAPGFRCQGTPYPVAGWVYGTAITFTTRWQNPSESCNSITSWTGFYSQGQIKTLWQLVVNGSSNTGQILQGSDVFTPVTHKKNESLMMKQ
jgi:hypothetical protein